MEDVRPYRNRNEENESRRNDDDLRIEFEVTERDEDDVPFYIPRD